MRLVVPSIKGMLLLITSCLRSQKMPLLVSRGSSLDIYVNQSQNKEESLLMFPNHQIPGLDIQGNVKYQILHQKIRYQRMLTKSWFQDMQVLFQSSNQEMSLEKGMKSWQIISLRIIYLHMDRKLIHWTIQIHKINTYQLIICSIKILTKQKMIRYKSVSLDLSVQICKCRASVVRCIISSWT